MTPESLAALEYIYRSSKAPTLKAFETKFAPRGQEVLNTILTSHVEVVNGKLRLNEAGVAIAVHEFGE